jgi:hypothetical protein
MRLGSSDGTRDRTQKIARAARWRASQFYHHCDREVTDPSRVDARPSTPALAGFAASARKSTSNSVPRALTKGCVVALF